ncbi:TauD-domain-containing protein [Pleurostoma richardsiae]|uniref:TauD-domain-containing protein n=1 Tax=Pleurostoma richardsiae TaxID=41990 RepID=A0AA38R3E0_9PEZI|nr:TauD-domain-containing protein [Pleurostoma richardsiae]
MSTTATTITAGAGITLQAKPSLITKGDESKIRTCLVTPEDWVPPADFKFPDTMVEMPLNLRGPTEVPQKTQRDYAAENYEWTDYLPYSSVTGDLPLDAYDHIDPASRADPEKKSLFSVLGERKDVTPNIGTEVGGQLSTLTDQQKDELALYVAERGVVIFRNQDFLRRGTGFIKEFASHFGRLHVHQFGPHVRGNSELTVLLRDSDDSHFDNNAAGKLTTTGWHSDMTYEINPPGTTFLACMTTPQSGGDTLYLNAMSAYDRLSEPMKKFLEGLTAIHEGTPQTAGARKSNIIRRPALDTVHPVIRKHPVTGRKGIFVTPTYVKKICELKQEESDAVLKMIFDHIKSGLDFHTRVKWEPGTIVLYDNRMVMHSVTLDYPLGEKVQRHMMRITPQGERPSL